MKILNYISLECQGYTLYYQDNRSIYINNRTRYIAGRIDASIWINELIDIYLKSKLIILVDFINHINIKKSKVVSINNDDYKQGLYDQLHKIDIKINDKIY